MTPEELQQRLKEDLEATKVLIKDSVEEALGVVKVVIAAGDKLAAAADGIQHLTSCHDRVANGEVSCDCGVTALRSALHAYRVAKLGTSK